MVTADRVLRTAVLLGALAGFAMVTPSGSAIADTTQRITLSAPNAPVTVKGQIAGYDGIGYLVSAQAGQTLEVTLSTANTSAAFNVTAPGRSEALFIGSVQGERFVGVAPATGDYRIDVYLMRNAARRQETAAIELRVSLSAAAGATGAKSADFADSLAGGPDFWQVANVTAGHVLNVRGGPGPQEPIQGHLGLGDVVRNLGCAMADGQPWCRVGAAGAGPIGWVHGGFLIEAAAPAASPVAAPAASNGAAGPVAANGQPFDATGTVPCARYAGQPTTACAFGVQRRGPGSADVFVAFAGGGQRLISFTGGAPAAADVSTPLTVAQELDLWFIRIGTERFEIPAAVATGG